MHVISRFNERVLLNIRGKACYSLWLNKRGLLGAWMLGQNQQANTHVVPVTLNCQPRTKEEINSHMQPSVKVKAFTYYWGHLSYHILRAHIAFKYITFPIHRYTLSHTHMSRSIRLSFIPNKNTNFTFLEKG